MASSLYGGTPMAPSLSSPGISGSVAAEQEQHSSFTPGSLGLSDDKGAAIASVGADGSELDLAQPSSGTGLLLEQTEGSGSDNPPKSFSPPLEPPASESAQPISQDPEARLLQPDSEAQADSDNALTLVNNTSSETTAAQRATALPSDSAPAAASVTEPSSTGSTQAASSTESTSSHDSSGTISAATGAAIAASLPASTSAAPSTVHSVAAPPASAPVSASPSPSSNLPPASTPASAAASNSRLVYPALHLFPLNNTFVPKCINLNPPGAPNRIKIGRQTTAKTAPNPTNGYFDSKVLSRAHAEIWSRDGKIYIKDVKSSNGTFINGERLSAEGQDSDDYELHSEDHVEFGIDIVSEDGRVVLHHKVACRVYVVITAEDAVNLQHDIANGFVGVSTRPASGAGGAIDRAGGGPGGTLGGVLAGYAGPGGPGGDASRRGGVGMGGGMGKGPGSMMNFDQVLTRLQTELKQSREAAAELNSISGVFHDIHETLAGGLPPLQQPPYQHLVPESEDKSRPNPAALAARGPDGLSAAEAEAAAAAKAASEAAAAAATKAKEEAEAKLAATTEQAAEQAKTVNQLQAQLSETQASLAEHIAKMRGLEEMLMEHEHLKGEVDTLRRLVADVSAANANSSSNKDVNGTSSAPHSLGWIPPPSLPSSLFSSGPPMPPASSSLGPPPPPQPPHHHLHDSEPELELFDAFKARASRKTPAMLAEEEERMRVLDQREREVEAERRRLAQENGSGALSTPTGEDSNAVVSSLLGPSPGAESGEIEHDFDDGASVASVDTVVPGSPPPAPKPSSSLPLADEDEFTLGDAPKPPAGMDEVEASRFGGASGGQGVPMRRRREESAPGLPHLGGGLAELHGDDAEGSRLPVSRDGKGNRRLWPAELAASRSGKHTDDEDGDDDDDDDDEGLQKNGHVGPLAPPDMPPGMTYDADEASTAWDDRGFFAAGRNGSSTRITRAQLLEENAKLHARLTSLEELLSEALALGRSLARDASENGESAGSASVSDGGDVKAESAAAAAEAVTVKAEPVGDDRAASTSATKNGPATAPVDMSAHVRTLEARISTLESEMDRRVAEVESEILRETQAKWELWRAQVEQGLQLERDSWERDHGRIFRKIVGDRAAGRAGAGSGGGEGETEHEHEHEEDDERSARSTSSGGTGDTDLSSSSGSAASTNATSPPSSIADSVGRFGKSLLGGGSGGAGGSPAPSVRSRNEGSQGEGGDKHAGRSGPTKAGGASSGAGPGNEGKQVAGGASDSRAGVGAAGARGGGSSKPFLFSDNSATIPALSAAGAVIVAMAVMAFAAKSAGPHK